MRFTSEYTTTNMSNREYEKMASHKNLSESALKQPKPRGRPPIYTTDTGIQFYIITIFLFI